MNAEDDPSLFQQQKPSRRKVSPGDVFAIKIPAGYLLGRVIATDVKSSAWDEPHLHLLYIYAGVRESVSGIHPSNFRPPKLLIPPVITNKLAWSRGYYETVAHIPLEPADLLERHIFREPARNPDQQRFWDEHARPVDEIEIRDMSLVGIQALQSYLTTENRVSLALGLGRTIDD